MTPIPLDQLRLNLSSHRSALWWLSLLYRKPKAIERAEASVTQLRETAVVLKLYLHTLPYLVTIGVAGRWLLFGILGLEIEPAFGGALSIHAAYLSVGLAGGLAVGLVRSLAVGLSRGLASSLAVGLPSGIALGLEFRLAGGLPVGLAFGIALGIAFGIAHSLARDLVLGLPRGLTFGIIFGIALGLSVGLPGSISERLDIIPGFPCNDDLARGVGVGIGFTNTYLLLFFRLYYFPAHLLFLRPWPRANKYRLHPAAWDDCCILPFPGLDRLLVAYAEIDREAAEFEFDRLIDDVPGQRLMALRARSTLIARDAAGTRDLAVLDDLVAGLPEGKKGFLADSAKVRQEVHSICVAQARLDTLTRPFLREPYAALLVKEIEGFESRIAGFHQPLATEFRQAARSWLEIARRQLDAARNRLAREPTRQVFRAGYPVDRNQEAFVPRHGVLSELDRQVMLATDCPGLVIYGRRRMGKSTLLRNLEGFLPAKVKVVCLSMQRAKAFTSLASLVTLIAEESTVVLPCEAVPGSTPTDLKGLEHFLGIANTILDDRGLRLVLAFDEYENLDRKIGEGVLSEDLLAVVRESIQSHRRIIWAFAGSHRIDELSCAPWTSYLVSARTVEVPMLSLEETRLLLTEPLRYSSLWAKDDPARPSFEPGFWGDGGIEQIFHTTGGWPHLVQLVAETVVDLVNDAGRSGADAELLETAFDRAVVRGDVVLRDLVERESTLPGELEYLQGFLRHDTQPPPSDIAVERSLRRRLLIVDDGENRRLRVPLMGRWLRLRG